MLTCVYTFAILNRWANVVDLGSSDQDNVRKQMEQYAATGNVDNPTFRAKKPEPRRYAEWDPRAQQQQQEEEEEEARRMQKQQQAAQAQRVRDTKVGWWNGRCSECGRCVLDKGMRVEYCDLPPTANVRVFFARRRQPYRQKKRRSWTS